MEAHLAQLKTLFNSLFFFLIKLPKDDFRIVSFSPCVFARVFLSIFFKYYSNSRLRLHYFCCCCVLAL